VTATALRPSLWALAMVATLVAARAADSEITLGLGGPFTGPFEHGGQQWQRGAELAVEEMNAAGGLLGHTVELELADDYCDADQAVAAAEKLVADRVAAVVGHVCSAAAIPASVVYEAARIPSLTLASNPRLTARGLRFTFRPAPRDDGMGMFAADYMVRQVGAKRIAIVHDTSAYGKGVAEATRTSLDGLGVPALLIEIVQPGQIVFADLVERLRRAAIEVLYYGGYTREAGLLRRQIAEAGFLPTMMAGSGVGTEDYLVVAGPAAEGTLIVADRPLETREYIDFEARFRALHGTHPDIRSRVAYRCAKIWAAAVAAAGTTDGTSVAQSLRSETFHVSGVDVRFDDKGNGQGPLAEHGLWVWRSGEPVPLH
jgi:branched-chain amino acid transport system substrate-binding protein